MIPRELEGRDASGKAVRIHPLWLRRQSTKFNGASYPVQAGAAACYTDRGRSEILEQIDYYLTNARVIRDGLTAAGYEVHGGVNAPYIWLRTPAGASSWDFFDTMLEKAHVVCTPGAGFGGCGEGFVRLSAFGMRASIEEAVERVRRL